MDNLRLACWAERNACVQDDNALWDVQQMNECVKIVEAMNECINGKLLNCQTAVLVNDWLLGGHVLWPIIYHQADDISRHLTSSGLG